MGVQVQRPVRLETASIAIFAAAPGRRDFIETFGDRMRAGIGERCLQMVHITPEAGQDEYEIPELEIDASMLAVSGLYTASTRSVRLVAETAEGKKYASRELEVRSLDVHAANVDALSRRGAPHQQHSGWYYSHKKPLVVPGHLTRSIMSGVTYRRPSRTEIRIGYFPGEVRVGGALAVRDGMRSVR